MLLIASESPKDLKEFARERHAPCPVLSDPDRKVFRQYGVGCSPTTMLIDRSGKIPVSLPGYSALMYFKEVLVPAAVAALRT